jgi:hypothetical protein
MKAEFSYLCTSCCCLWNTVFMKLCTLWDGAATAGNSLENRFLECLAVTSCCVRCQEHQLIFVPSGHFLILERAKSYKGYVTWIRWVVRFYNGSFLSGSHKLLTHHVQGHCHGGESTRQVRVRFFSSEQIPVTLSKLPNNTVGSPFVLVQRIHGELSACDRRSTQTWSWTASTSSHPPLNHLCHSKTLYFFIAYSW